MAEYVNNAKLRAEIIKCRETNVLSDEAIKMFQLMATKYITKLKFKYEEDRDDCIAGAVMDCFLYWRSYNPEKSDNAFAYFTTVIRNGYSKIFRKLNGSLPHSKRIRLSSNMIYNL